MVEEAVGQSAAILNSDFIAIVVVKDRHIVWANASMHRIFGYDEGELIGQATRTLSLDDASYEAFGREAYWAISKGETYSGTFPQKRKDGSTGWYEFNVSGLAGHPEIAVGAIVDRTAEYHVVQQLQASESLYRLVVEDQTEVIARFLPDGTFTFVNDVYCRLFGKSADQLVGHRWHPVAHPDDLPMIEAWLLKMSPENPVITIENRVYVNKGEIRWMQFVNRGFFDADGTLMETQSVGRDISKLKTTEATLREKEETLRHAQSVARIGSFTMTSDTETFGMTEETARLFDLGDKGVTTFDEWFSRVHPEDQAQVEAAWCAALQGAPYDMTYRIVVRGQVRWIRALAALQFDDHGRLTQAVGTVQDISDLKQIESSLRESDERLELALAGSGMVLWDWNIPERKVTGGDGWFELLGYTEEELGNEEDDWLSLINPKDLGRFGQKMSAHLQGETPDFENKHQLRHKDGHWVSVEARGKVTRRDKDHAPLRMVGTLRNITLRKRLNDEGMDLLKQIETLIRETSSNSRVNTPGGKAAENLTKRQREILGLVATGMTSAEIGRQLHLATQTVISHRRNLMAKLDLHSTAEATRFAIEHGLIASK